jgi:5'-methylthioadenosine nucleosidase
MADPTAWPITDTGAEVHMFTDRNRNAKGLGSPTVDTEAEAMTSMLVVMAMEAEARPFLERIGARPLPLPATLGSPGPSAPPLRAFGAEVGGCAVHVVVNGRHPRHGVDHIGTDAAALSTAVGILAWTPDLVVSAGTAGARRLSSLRLGDVVVASGHFVHHDRRIPIDGFRQLGIGSFPAADLDAVADGLGFATGVFSTGNSFGESAEDLAMLDASGAMVVDMESATVAMVAELYGVPVTGVRVVVNFIDDAETSIVEFETGLADAADVLADALVAIVGRRVAAVPDQPGD